MRIIEQFLETLKLRTDGTPIYIQIREQVLQAVGSGLLRPGERLPTMREVAVALRVDLHTVQRAYTALEQDKIVASIRGRGTFVAEPPPPLDPTLVETQLEALVHRTIAQARSAGIDPARLARAILQIEAELLH